MNVEYQLTSSGSISSAPLWAVLTPKMGEETEGQLSPPRTVVFHLVAAMCEWKFSSQVPSEPSWHQEGEKQSVHLPCLMPCHQSHCWWVGKLSSVLVYLLCCADMGAGEGVVVVVVMSTLLAPSCSGSSYLIDVGQEWKPTSSLSPTDSQTKNSCVIPAPAR